MSEKKLLNADETDFGLVHKRRQANKKVIAIIVDEWGTDGKPLILYAYPLTVNDVIAVDQRYASQAEQNVMQIIRQCLKGNGENYFTLLDKPALLNEPTDIIGDILVKLNAESSSFDQELKKNNE